MTRFVNFSYEYGKYPYPGAGTSSLNVVPSDGAHNVVLSGGTHNAVPSGGTHNAVLSDGAHNVDHKNWWSSSSGPLSDIRFVRLCNI